MCRQGLAVPADPRVWREACSLRDAGHRVTIIAPADPGEAPREDLDGIAIRRYRAPRNAQGWSALVLETAAGLLGAVRHVVALRLRSRIDVLHGFNPPDTFFLVALLLKPFGTKYVYDQADLVPELLRARGGAPKPLRVLMGWLERGSLRVADLVISPNSSFRNIAMARGGLPPQRVAVIRIGPVAARPVEPPPAGEQPVVTFAGVIGVQDDVEVLLVACADLLARRPGLFRVDIIGAGPDVPRLQTRCRELGIADQVAWTGWLTGPAFLDRLGQASIAVSPDSDTEFNRLATMVKITDYLSLGLPTIAAELPETKVTGGDAVLYFPPGDHAALATSIETLVTEPALAADLRARARALLWAPSGDRLAGLYAHLLDGGPPVPPEQDIVPAADA